MKRLAGISAGVMALGLLAYLGTFLSVQGQTPGVSSGPTKIATINMYVVMKKYKKVDMYKTEMQNLAKPFEDEIKKDQDNFDAWTKISKDPAKAQKERDDAGKYAVYYKRKVEDKRIEAQKILVKRGQEQIVQLYKEIEGSIQKYAAANGIHIVLHYLEPLGQEYTAANIDRKLNGSGNVGACGPIYIGPGVDISLQVADVLNSQYPSSGGATPAGGNGD